MRVSKDSLKGRSRKTRIETTVIFITSHFISFMFER